MQWVEVKLVDTFINGRQCVKIVDAETRQGTQAKAASGERVTAAAAKPPLIPRPWVSIYY